MGFFSPSKSSFSSESYSGLRAKDNMGAFNALLSRTPGDFNYTVDLLKDRVGNNNILNLNDQGFMSEQMHGVNKLGSQMFNKVSGNYAAMGLNNPENINAVIGGALTQASPALMGMIGENVINNQALQGNRFDQLLGALGLYQGLLGSESRQSGSTTGPSIGYNWATSFGNTFNIPELLKGLGSFSGGGGGGR